MIIDGRTIPDGTTLAADVCIVGSGFAGLSLALRLARESRLSVCVLESGDLRFDEAAQALAEAEVVGQPYYPLGETRIRAFGGSSMSWAGCCTPLDEVAFQRRPWVGDGQWPIAQAELNPYLAEALDVCGVAEADRRAAEATYRAEGALPGYDPGSVVPTLMYEARPARLGSDYLETVRSARNVVAYLHSTATEIESDDDGTRVSGVKVRCLTGTGFRVRARFHVLAAGGIENARLLLASKGSSERGLANASGVVGRYFMEHPRVVTRYRARPGVTPLARFVNPSATGRLGFKKVGIASDLQRREELLNFHANLRYGYVGELAPGWLAIRRLAMLATIPSGVVPFYHGVGGGRRKFRIRDVGAALRRPDLAIAAVLAVATQPPALRRFVEIYGTVEQVPDPSNRIELLREKDALGIPRVRLHWSVGETEERSYRRGLELVLAMMERLEPGISSAGVDGLDAWPSRVEGTWHHMGTTRMDDQPAKGVVDRNCRAHDVDNLYVVGSSVFPVSASLAPTLTIVQLALRLADHMARRLA